MSLPNLGNILWGVTWANNVAALELIAATSAATFLLRHHIGRTLAAWWHRHSQPHTEKHVAAVVERAMVSWEARLRAVLSDQPDQDKDAGGN